MTIPVRETALAVFKAGLSGAGPLGGTLASLLGDALQAHTDKTFRRTIALLEQRLEMLEQRIDLGTIDRDELAELFKSCYQTILRTHQEEKLRVAAALLVNILLREGDPDRMAYSEVDHLVRCLDGLSIGAIRALGAAVDLAAPRDLAHPDNDPFRFNFKDLQLKLKEPSPHLLMGLVGELNAYNLLHIVGVPAIPETNYANYGIELTPLGARFVSRLMRWDRESAGSA